MVNIYKKIKYANSRDDVIYALEEAGIDSSKPLGLLMKSARERTNWQELDLLSTAKFKLESFSK